MGILSKSLALTVYKTDFTPTKDDLIKGAFPEQIEESRKVHSGFVNIDDMLDLGFTKSDPNRARLVAFSFRMDTKRIPAAVLKKHLRIAFSEELAKTGKKFVSKHRKTEIKEQVMLRLLVRAEPVPATFDVVVDPLSGLVLLTSSSKSVKETFEGAWIGAFGEVLVEQTPEALFEADLPNPQGFLTEVFKSEGLTLPEGGLLRVVRKATVFSPEQGATMALESEADALLDLSAPLDSGQVVKASMDLETDSVTAQFSIRASDFGISGLRVPGGQEADEDLDGALLERVHLVEEVVSVIHKQYQEFMRKTAERPDVSANEF